MIKLKAEPVCKKVSGIIKIAIMNNKPKYLSDVTDASN